MLTIVWDVDDVLNGLMRDWLEMEWRPVHPECRLSYSDIIENPPHTVLGITEREYLESLDRFRLSDTAREMTPDARVLEWFCAFGAAFRHIALTARPLPMAGAAAEWVMRHFGGYIRVFGVVPCRRDGNVPHYDGSKSDFLAWWGKADILVDDSEENVAAAKRLGLRCILFPQPWNRGRPDASAALSELCRIVSCA